MLDAVLILCFVKVVFRVVMRMMICNLLSVIVVNFQSRLTFPPQPPVNDASNPPPPKYFPNCPSHFSSNCVTKIRGCERVCNRCLYVYRCWSWKVGTSLLEVHPDHKPQWRGNTRWWKHGWVLDRVKPYILVWLAKCLKELGKGGGVILSLAGRFDSKEGWCLVSMHDDGAWECGFVWNRLFWGVW